MFTASGALRPTNIIEPPQIRRDHATLQEYKKAQQLTDHVPIKEILREPPKSRRPEIPPTFRDRGCTTRESNPNGAGDMGAVVDWRGVTRTWCRDKPNLSTTWIYSTWRLVTSTRSGSRRSGMVIKTVYETARVFPNEQQQQLYKTVS